jgi:hypothetical protein
MPRRFRIPTNQHHVHSDHAWVTINGKDRDLRLHGSPDTKRRHEELNRKLLSDPERQELARRAQITMGG